MKKFVGLVLSVGLCLSFVQAASAKSITPA